MRTNQLALQNHTAPTPRNDVPTTAAAAAAIAYAALTAFAVDSRSHAPASVPATASRSKGSGCRASAVVTHAAPAAEKAKGARAKSSLGRICRTVFKEQDMRTESRSLTQG